jgi:hypothetical protein
MSKAGACFLVLLARGAGSAAAGSGCWAASRLQRLDLGVAFGDLLEVELVSREVLPQTEQVFLAIVASQRGDQLLV